MITFPYKRYYIKNVYELFENLRNYKCVIKYGHKLIGIKNILHKYIKGNDNYLAFISSNDDYESIDIITDYFQEEQRVKCVKIGSISTYDYYQNNKQELLDELQLSELTIDNVYQVRELLYKKSKECTQFKSTLVKCIYEYFADKIGHNIDVLDPCAGWGDRLIGALSCSRVNHYIGYDPNTNLKKGHDEIIDYFLMTSNDIINGKTFNYDAVNIIYKPFELSEFIIPFDLVFTSPPFFNLEIYDKDKNQSSNYNKYIDWMKNFLFKLLDLSWSYLKIGGYIAIHISDFKDTVICEPMNSYLSCFDSKYEGYIMSLSDTSNIARPIWVHKKLSDKKFDKGKCSFDFKTKYKNIYSIM